MRGNAEEAKRLETAASMTTGQESAYAEMAVQEAATLNSAIE